MFRQYIPLLMCFSFILLSSGVALGQSNQPDKYLDKVELQNGSVLWGIVETREQEIVIHFDRGNDLTFPLDQVRSIKKNKLNPHYYQKQDTGRYYRLNLGLLVGKSNQFVPNETSFNASLTAGYRFNPHLATGIGTGIYYYPEARHIPLYAELNGQLMNTRITPAYFVRTGWSWAFGTNDIEEFVDDVEGGLYLEPGMALRWNLPNRVLELAVSYVRQNSTTVWDPVVFGNGNSSQSTTVSTFQRVNLTAGITF